MLLLYFGCDRLYTVVTDLRYPIASLVLGAIEISTTKLFILTISGKGSRMLQVFPPFLGRKFHFFFIARCVLKMP
ncbi:hypothetical protein IQ270_07950 [Microcoleus sp. LEGE 07076]|nr:hypothetical protein [Microcoleus sp. LEGE 07076]